MRVEKLLYLSFPRRKTTRFIGVKGIESRRFSSTRQDWWATGEKGETKKRNERGKGGDEESKESRQWPRHVGRPALTLLHFSICQLVFVDKFRSKFQTGSRTRLDKFLRLLLFTPSAITSGHGEGLSKRGNFFSRSTGSTQRIRLRMDH